MSKKRKAPGPEPYLLVVEDNEPVAKNIQTLAGRYVEVIIAPTVATAWPWLASKHPPGGVVLDFELPDGSGIEMFERFRKLAASRRTLCILMSGTDRSKLPTDPRELRLRFVQKPVFISASGILDLAAAVAARDDIDRLIAEWTQGTRATRAIREVLEASSWVPRYDLADVLGISESAASDRITRAREVLGPVHYEDMQRRLQAIAICNARGGLRGSRKFRRIESASELLIEPGQGSRDRE